MKMFTVCIRGIIYIFDKPKNEASLKSTFRFVASRLFQVFILIEEVNTVGKKKPTQMLATYSCLRRRVFFFD